jgi:hypothetical protein
VLDARGSRDPEGAPLRYRWSEVPGGDSRARPRLPRAGETTASRALTLDAVPPGRYKVRLAVTDGERVSRSGPIGFEVLP